MTQRPLWLAFVICPLLLGACKKQSDSQSPDASAGDASDASSDVSGDGGGASEAAVEEVLTVDVFEAEMERKKDDIAGCYAQAKEAKPDLAGKLALDITVAGDGSVEKVAFDPSNSLKDPSVTSCVEGKSKEWKFPRTRDGASMTLPYSLNLQ